MDAGQRRAACRALAGHRAGVEALRKTVRAAPDLGISCLTVYAFSSENWSRPKAEVSDLMGLLKLFIRRDLAELHQSGVRVRIIGDREGLQPDIEALLEEAEIADGRQHEPDAGDRLQLWRARRDRSGGAQACRRPRRAAKSTPEAITAETLCRCLDTADIPDPELVIRTSGELRLSNFLLWQAAYSELVFLPCYWPDFSREHLAEALRDIRRPRTPLRRACAARRRFVRAGRRDEQSSAARHFGRRAGGRRPWPDLVRRPAVPAVCARSFRRLVFYEWSRWRGPHAATGWAFARGAGRRFHRRLDCRACRHRACCCLS